MLAFHVVDAFTDTIFSGNPAAVIILDDALALSDETMQLMAREFNLSETAFVVRPSITSSQQRVYGLRWFTPENEVALCGHATLASAHIMFQTLPLDSPENVIRFQTRKSGILRARRLVQHQGNVEIEIELPAGAVTDLGVHGREMFGKVECAVNAALGVTKNENGVVEYVGHVEGSSFEGYLLVELKATFDLEGCKVNTNAFVSCVIPYTNIISS